MTKEQVVIWGIGNSADEVYDALDFSVCELYAVVDRDKKKYGERWRGKYKIQLPEEIDDSNIDYYIVSAKSPTPIVKDALNLGVAVNKLVLFWDTKLECSFLKKEYLLKRKNAFLEMRLNNAPYEYGKPRIHFIENEELFRKLKEESRSLARFGDGEFEIIRGKKRGWFQHRDELLANRLLSILTERQDKIVLAIADNFGNLDKYTEDAADAIREYLSGNTRKEIMKFLPLDYLYGDAYITRFYLMYRDKSRAEQIIHSFKELWKSRDVVIVEGKYSRMGIGNDLFKEAKSIRRIVCPHINAFDYYELIKKKVIQNVSGGELVLVSLGQTATVLAYDLGMLGIQTIDIGQLDTEYEWYLKGAENREEIPGKSVAEIPWWHEPDCTDNNDYNNQVIAIVDEREYKSSMEG